MGLHVSDFEKRPKDIDRQKIKSLVQEIYFRQWFGSDTKSVILVADDEALFLTSVAMTLQRQGYTVLSASDGAEALKLSRRHRGSIDMVVTDVAMPRMNGIDLVAHLAEERPGIKVLLISGTNMRRAISPDLDQAFLPKPVDGQTLLARIRTLLAAPV